MSPRAVADIAIDAIRADCFYVFSHPEYVPGIEGRYQEIHQSVEGPSN